MLYHAELFLDNAYVKLDQAKLFLDNAGFILDRADIPLDHAEYRGKHAELFLDNAELCYAHKTSLETHKESLKKQAKGLDSPAKSRYTVRMSEKNNAEIAAYLVKLGELTLKGDNRGAFESVLQNNIREMLAETHATLAITNGRYVIRAPAQACFAVEDALSRLYGIAGWAKTRIGEKSLAAILHLCVETALSFGKDVQTFKIEARRTDKSFPLDSFGLMASAGEAVLSAIPSLGVDVHHPDAVITIEVREKAYVYADTNKGLRGLPVGTAGKGLLLLSGGIDSPVAGILMAGRGVRLVAAHFHTYPFTSRESQEKVGRLAGLVARYAMGVRLYQVCFTPVQQRIGERAPTAWSTVLLRMAMVEAGERIARERGCKCIISGESLGQVASQTMENLACVESRAGLPILRPLIGMDKDGIIKAAERYGTYSVSIEPHADCCAMFSPEHPILRGDRASANELYEKLELGELISAAVQEASSRVYK